MSDDLQPRLPNAEAQKAARKRLLEDVRRRLKNGELDSTDAAKETAAALLDGDEPAV
ncbi:MAG: hypothetical protein V3T86_13035 [Planctomycetota bacterium]